MKQNITYGEKYGPAMEITDQAKADAYFEECVQHTMTFGKSREEAESIERQNLGYYAGYYSNETRERVERLFRCAHPIFGSIEKNGAPTPEEAFEAGIAAARVPPRLQPTEGPKAEGLTDQSVKPPAPSQAPIPD